MKITSLNNYNYEKKQNNKNISFGFGYKNIETLAGFISEDENGKKASLLTRLFGKIVTPMANTIRDKVVKSDKTPKAINFVQKNLSNWSDNIQARIQNPDEASLSAKFLAKGIGKLLETQAGQGVIKWASKFKNVAVFVGQAASWLLTLSRINNTRKSEKIEEERKAPLMLNDLSVTVVSTILSTVVDRVSDKAINALKNASFAIHKDEYKAMGKAEGIKALKTVDKMIRKTKSLTVFTLIVRFAVPVVMVTVVGKIMDAIKSKKEKDDNELRQAKVKAVMQKNAQIKPVSFKNFFNSNNIKIGQQSNNLTGRLS